jgi:hypothetical protein
MTTHTTATAELRRLKGLSRRKRLRLGLGLAGLLLALTQFTGQAWADTGTVQRKPHPHGHHARPMGQPRSPMHPLHH